MSSRHIANELFKPSTEKSAEALAAAAEASGLAKKVRDRSTEQAIDKPTQTFGRRRNNSASSAVQEKVTSNSHALVGENQNLVPLTFAIVGSSNLTGSCRSQDTGESAHHGTKPNGSNDPSEEIKLSFTPERRDPKPSCMDLWGVSLQAKTHSRALKQNSAIQPTLDSGHPAVKTVVGGPNSISATTSPKLSFASGNPSRFYRTLRLACVYLETINLLSSKKAWRLFEWCDFSWTPEIIRYVNLYTVHTEVS